MDVIASEAEYNVLTGILGEHLDCVIGYRQASGADEPAAGWRWDSSCVGFQPPWHGGVADPGLGHDEPNDWSPRLSVHEDCATMWNGKISDVTCEWDTESNWLPTECLCQDSLPCTTTTTTAVDPNAPSTGPGPTSAIPTLAATPPPTTAAPTTAAPCADWGDCYCPSLPSALITACTWVPVATAVGVGLILVACLTCCVLARRPAEKKKTRAARTIAPSAPDAELAPLMQVPFVPLMVNPMTSPAPMFVSPAPQFVTMQGMQPVAPQPSLSLPLGQVAPGGYAMSSRPF